MSLTKLNRYIIEQVLDKSIGYKEHLFHSQDISIPSAKVNSHRLYIHLYWTQVLSHSRTQSPIYLTLSDIFQSKEFG